MPGTPPRLAPTLALAVTWLAVYLLWLAVKPDGEVKTTTKPGTVVSTTATTAKPLVPPIRLKP